MSAPTIIMPDDARSLRLRLTLLIGQSLALGLTLALLFVTATALLLSFYGAGALPYVYIVVAVLGSAAFYGFGELLRRYTLVQVSVVTELVIVGFLLVAWLGLAFAGARWLAFASVVAFSLIIQVGFVILGGQAGRLLDVRQIKRYFPRVVAGFAVGFTVGGALVGPLQRVLAKPENLLFVAASAALGMLGFLLATNWRFGAALRHSGPQGPQAAPPPLGRLLSKTFVTLIFLYQMLSAMASQLLDFMVMSAAGNRFSEPTALASFFGQYTFYLNLADILFLALLAGFLLNRFGLRYGLAANPAVVVLLVIAIVTVGLVAGPAVPLFFWLVVIARPTDIVLTDGTTRTSINAAFQALPGQERVAVQTAVEGIGVPVALGLTGVVLLIFDAIPGASLIHIAAFALLISLLWTWAGLLVYRHYGTNLRQTMRRRAVDPVALTLDDASSLAVVERFLRGDNVREVCLGLDLLESAGHAGLTEHLLLLVQHPQPAIRQEALGRIERLRSIAAAPVVAQLAAHDPDPAVRGAAVRASCALDTAGVDTAVRFLDDPEPRVREGALVGLLRYAPDPARATAEARWRTMAHSPDPATRAAAAEVLAEAGPTSDSATLAALLVDPDPTVRCAALLAASQGSYPALIPGLIEQLDRPATRAAAMTALIAHGTAILPAVGEALASVTGGTMPSHPRVARLVRAAGQVGGPEVQALLWSHVPRVPHELRAQLLHALHASDFRVASNNDPELMAGLRAESRHGLRILIAQAELGDGQGVQPVQRALADELAQVCQRLFLWLALHYEVQSTTRAAMRLAEGGRAQGALAMEMLSLTLSAAHQRLVFPLIDPELSTGQRIQQLERQGARPRLAPAARLRDLITDPESVWQNPWLSACALYAAGTAGLHSLADLAEQRIDHDVHFVRETAMWALGRFVSG